MTLFKAVVILIATSVAVAVLSALAARSRAPADVRGWRTLKPGAMHWVGLGLGGGLVLLMAYVRFFVGSTRADAESQMTVLSWLIVAFGLGTIPTALSVRAILRRPVRWRGTTLEFAGKTGRERRSFDEVAGIGSNALQQMVLTFTDGATLKLDPYATGASELLQRLEEHRGTGGGGLPSDDGA